MLCELTCLLALLAFGYTMFRLIKFKFFPPRASPYTADWKKDMVYLYQFTRSPVIPSISPFCLKLETWLRIAGVKYENVEELPMSTRSREGLMPFVEINGVEYPDSSLAIRDMIRIFQKESLDEHEDTVCLGVARAVQALVEGTLFQTMVYARFIDNIQQFLSPKMLPKLKGWMKPLLPVLHFVVPGQIMKRLKAGGIGKHTREDIMNIAREDLRALSRCLGDKKFYLGDKASSVDCGVFGGLAQMVYIDGLSPDQSKFIREECPNLVQFCDRIKDAYWPDWNQVTEQLQENSEFMKNMK